MNPNAKEFVPAHLLKKRQEETVGELTSQIASVEIDESRGAQEKGQTDRKSPESGDTTAQAAATTCSRDKAPSQAQEKKNNSSPKKQTDGSAQAPQQNSPTNNHHSHRTSNSNTNNVHHKTNGDSKQDPNEDDRHLLRAGENYCEFNGEQFIIPGEEEEYTGSGQDYQPASYDFGNAEDNEDEDVCNAYEEFLNDLPQ